MNIRTIACACLLGLVAPCAMAVNDPPLAEAWDIRTTGVASSSGDIVLRVTPPDGSDPVEITVPVLAGATDLEVARAIRRALSSQLRSDQFNVSVGDSANVLVTNPRGRAIFGVGLVTSDVDSMRIFVNSATTLAVPVAPPMQTVPASGAGVTPPESSTPLPQKSTPTPQPPNPGASPPTRR
jgi:hypothetical protein